MKKTTTFFILFSFFFSVTALLAESDFERYQVILDKRPFGELKIEAKPVADPKTSFAKNLEIRSIISDDYGLRVSFYDTQLKENFRLRLNETRDGMVLISADYDAEEASLRKGLEICKFSLKDEKTTSIATTPQVPSPSSSPMRATPQTQSSFQGDPNRANPLAMRKAARQPIARGETIESFIQKNPEAAQKIPSPLNPLTPEGGQSWPPPGSMVGRGETIERYLKDNPNAAGQFPSPITPPRQGEVATGRGATIDNLLMNQPEQEAISQFQLPIGTHLTDDDGNVIQPIGITEDGTPIYDFIQTD